MSKGIERCKMAFHLNGTEGDSRFIKQAEVIVIYPGYTPTFFVDEECLGKDTVNKNATIDGARWAHIYNAYYNVSTVGNDGKQFGLWADIGHNKPFIKEKGIGNQYKVGPSFDMSPNGTSYYYGCVQRVELFSGEPDKGFYFYVIPLTEPYIALAQFENKVFNYGDLLSFMICLHEIPSNTAFTETKYKAKIYFVDYMTAMNYGESGSTSQFEKINLLDEPLEYDIPYKPFNRDSPGSPNVNTYLKFSGIPIQEKWRHQTNHESGETEYTIVIEIYEQDKKERVFIKNFASSPTANLQQFDAKLLDVEDVTLPKSGRFSSFLVDYETAFMKIEKLEIQKKNMIQYIGDVNYTIKEYDPCHYSAIEVHEKVKGKDPVEIFNEDKLSSGGDRTDEFYDIVLGEVSDREIKITAKDLKTKEGCQGVLLEKGKKHADIHNVFAMKYVFSALLSSEKSIFGKSDLQQENTVKVDNTRVAPKTQASIETQRQLPPKRDNNYEGKYKYEKDNSQTTPRQDYDPVAVSKIHFRNVFKWEENKDYSLDDKGAFIIHKLNYTYVKTFDSELARYLGYDDRSLLDDMADKALWAFRYFFLYKEFAQVYFVPVSSCRYPNQLAKIRVFPDIKWEVYIMVIPTESLAYGAGNMEYSPQKADHEKKEKGAYKSKNPSLVDYKVELHVKSSIKGEVTDLSLGMEQKLGKYLGAASKLKTTLDLISHKNNVVKGAGASASAMVAKIGTKGVSPFFIDFSLPSLQVGGAWRFDIPKGEKDAAVIGSVEIALKPLLKAKGGIDLIAAMHYIPVVGEIILAIEVIKDLTEMSITSLTPLDVSSKLWFNLYAFGQLDIKLGIDFFNSFNSTLEPKLTFGIGAELGLKIEAFIKKVIFNEGEGDRETLGGIGGELSGKGETGLELKAKLSANTHYPTVEGSISFLGITLEVVGKFEITIRGNEKDKSKPPTSKGKLPLVKRIDDFEKFKWELK